MSEIVKDEVVVKSESYFDGDIISYIGLVVLTFLLSVISLGLAFPWVYCMTVRWTTDHTVIEGRRLKFVGTGAGLFGQYIKWFLLSIVTLGIYSFWLYIKLKQWETQNTIFA